MSKFSGASEKAIQKWIKRGDGQGEGKNYRPFFHVRDVPSRGRSRKVFGIKTGRIHHYLSDIEYWHHLLSEYDQNIVDIREQYALLPREETQEIAEQLGIEHPIYPTSQIPIVMTSDIVLSGDDNPEISRVISVKSSSDVDPENPTSKRTLQKLLIEKLFWTRRGIPWELSTEKDICLNTARNLDMLRTPMIVKMQDSLSRKTDYFIAAFHKYWSPCNNLNEILNNVSQEINININEGFVLFGWAVWMKRLPVDLEFELILHNFPIRMYQHS